MATAPVPPVLHLTGVTQPPALPTPLDLTVHPGEFVAVLGTPGSGKSTLLSLAAGLSAPATGHIAIDGAALATLPRAELVRIWLDRVARVPQDADTALDPHLTAAENIALPLELSGEGARTARQRALTILFEMELGEIAERRPAEISGAHRKAVTVARALAGERRLVLADEPTDGLDGEIADTLLALLRMRRPAGAAVLMTTSDPDRAAWADRIVLLRELTPTRQAG
ncbi:ATP-binding cassette domain-containing protein [Streptomyces sp. 6N223]|uniref:ATP-binding cassette domain-containing protein n=1 Tax=Streptomyces sp. 6N223 TaxID=3457412 RepID=UPI003FD1D9E3